MMIRRLYFLAKFTPATISLAFVARIAYAERNPSRHVAGHPAGGPDPVAVLGSQVLLLQTGVMGRVA